jgi:branched-chain amino acid transport system ATP-binding protein
VSLLTCTGVAKRFGGVQAVVDGSLALEAGSTSCLIGPNGAGKTTFFNLISGVLSPDSGTIMFAGKRIDRLPAFRRARLRLSRTFQDPRLFHEMTVRNHVLAGIAQRSENALAAICGGAATRRDRRAALARADALLDKVGLLARAADMADQLSFGEQRFLSIARSLGSDPTLLMLDEPTVGMDEAGIRKLELLIRALVRDHGVTILMVEHNMDIVFRLVERIHLMLQGAVVASGSTAEMRGDARFVESYLGKRHAARH